MKIIHQAVLPLTAWLVVWLAPIVALPIYLVAFIDAGWSASGPHFPIGVLILLGIAPFMAGLALLGILRFGKVTLWNYGAAHTRIVEFCRAEHRLRIMENGMADERTMTTTSACSSVFKPLRRPFFRRRQRATSCLNLTASGGERNDLDNSSRQGR